MSLFKNFDHLGFHSPFYLRNEDHTFHFDRDNANILQSISQKEIDVASVIELLSTGFCFGDRTLVKGIQRTPWMAKPNPSNNDWIYADLPVLGHKNQEVEEVVKTFYSLLRNELIDYIENHSKIGLLLTGGMDSRVVACILNDLVENKYPSKEIYAFTWGGENSRDVVYARQIAAKFKWSWQHLVVDVDQMRQNMDLVIDEGCEFTPVHLHAMSKIISEKYLDCVLAGSFGDSVGRGEYSGTRAVDLVSLKSSINNVASLFSDKSYQVALPKISDDLARYWRLFPRPKDYQLFEQDQQIHYMRRMLNPCMNVIDKKIPLYQMFSSPEVFGYIWSLNTDLRTDKIYYTLLNTYCPYLLQIPWARTGLAFPLKEGQPDQYEKKHHDYATMIRNHFLEDISDSIERYELREFGIFNYPIIKDLIKYCQQFPIKGSIFYEERLLWLACFAKYVRLNDIRFHLSEEFGLSSRINAGTKYFSKYFYKAIKGK